MTGRAAPPRAGLRRLAPALLWGGAALSALSAGQPWAAGSAQGSGTAATSGGALAVVLAALAGSFLWLWVGPVARRVLAVLVALLLLSAVPIALTAQPAGDPTWWRWLYPAAAGVGAIGAALLAALPHVARGRSDRPDAVRDPWRDLDAGRDPTVDDERGAGGDPLSDRPQ